jgi:cytidine deaminase
MTAVAPSTLAELVRLARAAARNAHAPYSRFPVGAAVLTDRGEMHAAANVENASYGLSMCAERAAIFAAIAQGARKIVAIAVYTPTAEPTPPCGACRQVAAEFAADTLVICSADAGGERRYTLAELLPHRFGAGHL